MEKHIPVLIQEVTDGLNLSSGAVVIDATVGLGGHAKRILQATAPDGRLIGFDRDDRNLELAEHALSGFRDRVRLIHDSYANMNKYDLPKADAILFDLGFSSVHVDDPERGFSFLREGPLDMRYDTTQELTAEAIVNSWSKDDLNDLFRKLGEEPRAREAAKAILEARKKQRITTTTQLADILKDVLPRRGKAHPATRVFQALRIAVNDELGELKKGLQAAQKLLKPHGRLAVISFHSLEDRIVKYFNKDSESLSRVNKKPIRPDWPERKRNPRARSAKLRIAEKRNPDT